MDGPGQETRTETGQPWTRTWRPRYAFLEVPASSDLLSFSPRPSFLRSSSELVPFFPFLGRGTSSQVTLKSSDDESFAVDQEVANMSETIKNMIEGEFPRNRDLSRSFPLLLQTPSARFPSSEVFGREP